MAAPQYSDLDMAYNQLLRGRASNLAADPTPSGAQGGAFWYRTDTKQMRVWNGTTYDLVTGGVETVTATGALSVVLSAARANGVGQQAALTIAAASASVPGTMSASDYSKLAASTAANTASAIVQRDGSGNFAAGVITAALTGTASNATNLNSQPATFYLARANQTGTQLAATISDLATTVQAYSLSSFAAPTGPLSIGSQRLTNVADPTNPQDAATKNYVDASAAGYDVKASVRVATITNVNIASPGTAIDGVTLAVGDRFLLAGQTTASQNGIYVYQGSGTAATRSTDSSTGNSPNTNTSVNAGDFVFVEQGTSYAATAWVLTTQGTITLGTTSLTFTQVGSQTQYTAGSGLTLAGNQFSVVGTANRISVGASVDISASYVGQTSITTLGTIGTGVWQGTAVGVAYGGTGATTAAGARANLGATTSATGTFTGDGTTTSFTATHSLGKPIHSFTLIDNNAKEAGADITLATNTDTIVITPALANGVVFSWIAIA